MAERGIATGGAVPFLDLAPLHGRLEAELTRALSDVLRGQQFILGEHVARFEAEVAEYLGARHAVGVSSGSDALLCSLLALGIGAGDEVLVPALGFVATPEAVLRAGARVRFVDVEAASGNIDPDRARAAVGPRTKALVAVHLYGAPARMDALARLAEQRRLAIVEDAAQAFGAGLGGQKLGCMGALGCFSFFPSKPLGALGDGGLIVTADDELAARCRALRVHGRGRGGHERVGGNFRLDALQAAVLSVKLRHFPEALVERSELAARYDRALAELPGVRLPLPADGAAPAFGLYTLRFERDRDRIQSELSRAGIETRVYYPRPLSDEPVFAPTEHEFPVARALAEQVLSLPLYPGLPSESQARIIATLAEAMESK